MGRFEEITEQRKFLAENFGIELKIERGKGRMVANPATPENIRAAEKYNYLASVHGNYAPTKPDSGGGE